MTLVLKVGNSYRNRLGEIKTIETDFGSRVRYRFSDGTDSYTGGGGFFIVGKDDYDLIELVEDPKTEQSDPQPELEVYEIVCIDKRYSLDRNDNITEIKYDVHNRTATIYFEDGCRYIVNNVEVAGQRPRKAADECPDCDCSEEAQ